MNRRIAPFSFAFLSLFVAASSTAQWAANGSGVCTLAAGQHHPVAALDGAGGAIIAWEDSRNSATSGIDVYVQRLDLNGHGVWAAGGVALCTEAGDQTFLSIVSDGAGGAIVAWGDGRNGPATVFAQRVSSAGAAQWTSGGIAMCAALPEQNFPAVVSDGNNGAIVAWLDTRTGDFDVYAQRVNAFGALQWTATAAPICTVAGLQHSPFITTDGAGGAIMAWTDERGLAPDIYAQRISASGAVQWAVGGAAVCQASRTQSGGLLASDGAGGAIIAWVDGRLGNSVTLRDIYAQHINGAGVAQWALNGVAVCGAPGEQGYPNVVADGTGGAIIAWHDFRAGNWDVYAQRIDGAGAAQWTSNGVALCTATGTQWFVSTASDGAGGALIAWPDGRDGTGTNDVYAQRIDATGAVRWVADGVALCALSREQSSQTVVSDGAGGAIVAWDDMRTWDGVQQPSEAYTDIYANRVTASGWSVTAVGDTPAPRAALAPNVPNPFSQTTRVDLVLDHDSPVAIDVFDVAGRRVRHIDMARMPAGRTTVSFDGRDEHGRLLPSGAYFFRVSATGAQLTRKMLILR